MYFYEHIHNWCSINVCTKHKSSIKHRVSINDARCLKIHFDFLIWFFQNLYLILNTYRNLKTFANNYDDFVIFKFGTFVANETSQSDYMMLAEDPEGEETLIHQITLNSNFRKSSWGIYNMLLLIFWSSNVHFLSVSQG